MSIRFEHAIDVARGRERIFAILDDLSQTPRWLARCTGIEKARTPNERLTMGYADKMMEVVVDFHMTKRDDGGARLVHVIDIRPKSLFAKLFAPLVRRQLPQQTIAAMETLRGLVEGGGAASPSS